MKKMLFGTVAAIALGAGSALAADMPPPRTPMAPVAVPPPAYNWTGFYSASSLGGQWWDIKGTYVASPLDHHNTSGSRGIYGSHIGYQYQAGSWVLGVEAAYNSPSFFFDDNFTQSTSPSGDCLGGSAVANRTCESRIKYYWTVGGKVGWAWNNFMVYGTGGYASGRVETDTLITSNGVITSFTKASNGGWYAGAGADLFVMKVFWSDLILGVEYEHVELDSKLHVDTLAGATGVNNRFVSAREDVVRAKATWKYGN
jgi:outer membrane immunogenic protein